jgi:hypothetical protein
LIISEITDKVFGPEEQPNSAIAKLLGWMVQYRFAMALTLDGFSKEIAFC